MNGCVSRRSRAAASASPLRSIGVPNFSRNRPSPPSRPGVHRIEDRPEFAEPVLDGRPGQRQLLSGAQLPHRPGRLGVRVLDHLRLVEHDGRPVDGAEVFEVAGQQAVGRDDDEPFGIGGEEGVVAEPVGATAAAAVMDLHVELRGEPSRFAAPVADHAERAHDEVRAGTLDEVGQRRGGLAETHVVGEAAPEAELGQELHPRQAPPLVVPQFAGEVLRFHRLLEHLVGEPVEEHAHPVEVDRLGAVVVTERGRIGCPDRTRCGRLAESGIRRAGRVTEPDERVLLVAVVVVGEPEEFERLHSTVVAPEVLELLTLASELVGVDANPAVAGVEQRRSCLGRAGEFGLGDRFVADHHRPVDERLVAELLLAVVGGCRGGFAVDADACPHEPLRPDQFDAEALQLGGRDVDEVLGDVQFEFDRGRFVLERQVGEPGDERGPRHRVGDGVGEQVEVAVFAGDVASCGVAIPHVVGGAPS